MTQLGLKVRIVIRSKDVFFQCTPMKSLFSFFRKITNRPLRVNQSRTENTQASAFGIDAFRIKRPS